MEKIASGVLGRLFRYFFLQKYFLATYSPTFNTDPMFVLFCRGFAARQPAQMWCTTFAARRYRQRKENRCRSPVGLPVLF